MVTVWIILGIAGLFIGGSAVAGIVCYYRLALPNMKSLTEEQLSICKKVIDCGRNFPWLCRRALKKKECPCFPCDRFKEAGA
ncbi:MAG: hypothetical protein JW969_10715 [Spirochaetales bacterium]|nr:hypothetical protein [Spirochaetales bacterium]